MNSRLKKTAVYVQRPFRRAVLRGLGVVLPPLLTIVILAWIFNTVQEYVLTPVQFRVKQAVTHLIDRTHTSIPDDAVKIETDDSPDRQFQHDGVDFVSIGNDQWIPVSVFERVRQNPGLVPPATSEGYYHRYVELKYLKPYVVLPVFISGFVLFLYLLGRFLAYGLGRVMYNAMEAIISQLPIIRTVYTSVKKVTDFVFSESDMEFNRVVAVEYPRKGIWSLGFVTGEGLRNISDEAGEPILTVLIPTSPMPATGYTITIRRSEVVDLDITVDQAFQFIVSCGVVVPMHQQGHSITEGVQPAIGQHLAPNALDGPTVGEQS